MENFTLTRAVEAADGFLLLGLPDEAWEELDNLPPDLKATKPVVGKRIEIYRALGKWSELYALAETMAKHFPEEPRWWIELAEAVRHEHSPQEAREVLLRAAELHSEVALINYHLGCCAFAVGEIEEGMRCLKRAFSMDPSLRERAIEEKDLAPIWDGQAA